MKDSCGDDNVIYLTILLMSYPGCGIGIIVCKMLLWEKIG